MQAVSQLDEHHAYVVGHGEEKLAYVLGLLHRLVHENATRDLGESDHDTGNLGTKLVLNVFGGVVGVLHHIVQKGSADAGATQSNLFHHNTCDSQRVHHVGLSREAADATVRLARQVIGTRDDIHLLAVACVSVV